MDCIARTVELYAWEQIVLDSSRPLRILDPMAGVGGINELQNLIPYSLDIKGIELEPEWAEQGGMICGDARNMGSLLPDLWVPDMIVVSVPYANRMADKYLPDKYRRMTYANALGRDLTLGSAASMQWGRQYQKTMAEVWEACANMLPPNGMLILNCKNHIRASVIIPVTKWHVYTLSNFGFEQIDNWFKVSVPHMRYGQNSELRVEFEDVVVMRKCEQRTEFEEIEYPTTLPLIAVDRRVMKENWKNDGRHHN